MRDNISPEEKLLRLIRVPKKADTVLVKTTVKAPHLSRFGKYISFLEMRKIILVIFAISAVYLIITLIYPWVILKKVSLPQVTQVKIKEPEIQTKPEIKPFEFYQQAIQNRQIFAGTSAQATEMPSRTPSADLLKDINLVGIVSGDNPVGVIEDKKTQKTYYVSKGQFMGEFQVEDIQAGKIILNYRGERFELYL